MSKLFNKRKSSKPAVVTSATKIASTLAEVSADLKRRGAKDVLEDADGSMNGWLPVSQAKNLPAADGDDYHFEFSGRTEIKDGEKCSEFWLYSIPGGEEEGPEEQFIVSKTYEIWDDESIDAGDTDQRGFEVKNEIWDRSDVIRELEQHNYIYPSSSDINSLRWVSTDGDTNHSSGEVTSYSLHLKDIRGHELDGDQWASLLKEAGLLDSMHLTGVKTSSGKTAASSMGVAKHLYGFAKEAEKITKCVDCGKSMPVSKMVENSEGAGYLCPKCKAIREKEDAAKEGKAKGVKMAEEFEDLAQQLRTCDGMDPDKAARRINSVLSELSEALKHFGYPGLATGVTKEGSSKTAFGTRDKVLEKWVRKVPLGPPAVDEIELVDEISVSPNGDERHYYLVRTYPDIFTGGSSETLGEAKRYLNHLKDNGGNKGQFVKKVGSFSTGENPTYVPTHEDEIAKAKIREERAKRTAPAPDPSKDDISDIFHSITGHPGAKGRGEIKKGCNKRGHQAPMSCIANLDALKARRAVQAGRRSL
jgi:hypothetical protein